MSRLNLEESELYGNLWRGGKWDSLRKILTGNYVMPGGFAPPVQFFDPDGSNRDITLPAVSKGLVFVIVNIGGTGDLVVKNSIGSTVATFPPGNGGMVVSSDSEWGLVQGPGADGADGSLIFSQDSAPATSNPEGSLWIDTDSVDIDIYRLTSSVWTDTGVNLAATGDVLGPASATDSAIVLFDTTTGKLLKDSAVLLTALATNALLASTSNAEGASLIGVEDSGGNYTATQVEAVLAEIATALAARALSSDLASTANALGASLIGIEDSGGLITATTVEAALAEIAGDLDNNYRTNTILASTSNAEGAALIGIEDSGAIITATTVEGALAEIAAELNLLASTSNGEGASLIGIEDAAGDYTATTVEAALAEVKALADTALQQGRETLVVPASAWLPTITNGATRAYGEYSTNDLMADDMTFDETTQQFATFSWYPPQKWNAGTVTFRYRWRSVGGGAADTLDMAVSAVAISNDDPEDAAPGTPVVVTDTWIADGDHHISSESAAVTIGGTPAKADKIVFKLQRNVSTDDLTGGAYISAVEIFWTSNANTDTP